MPGGLKVGLRVRHPTFGVGTVTALEPLDEPLVDRLRSERLNAALG